MRKMLNPPASEQKWAISRFWGAFKRPNCLKTACLLASCLIKLICRVGLKWVPSTLLSCWCLGCSLLSISPTWGHAGHTHLWAGDRWANARTGPYSSTFQVALQAAILRTRPSLALPSADSTYQAGCGLRWCLLEQCPPGPPPQTGRCCSARGLQANYEGRQGDLQASVQGKSW